MTDLGRLPPSRGGAARVDQLSPDKCFLRSSLTT